VQTSCSRALVCVGLSVPAPANDSFVHQSAGNLMFVQSYDVAIQRERLVIGPPIQFDAHGEPQRWQLPVSEW